MNGVQQAREKSYLVRLSILTRFWSREALDVWIAGCVGGTEAVGKLVIGLADCCGGAGVVGKAWVSTEGENTGVVVQAVSVEFASSRGSWTNNC